MASTSRPNEALWREISQGLAAAGYSRNVAQCRSKWKALKQAFYSECHSPRVPPHYRTMKKIWKAAGRPVFGDRCLPGPSVVSLLQSMQQLLVQILRTSQQQQVLLESLASDTLSHLISENVVQVGKTLHELLLQAHARSADLPTPLSRYAPPPQSPPFPRPQRGTCGVIRLWFPPPPAAPPPESPCRDLVHIAGGCLPPL
ncbi:unnamed protein product [Caretta caretta]